MEKKVFWVKLQNDNDTTVHIVNIGHLKRVKTRENKKQFHFLKHSKILPNCFSPNKFRWHSI